MKSIDKIKHKINIEFKEIFSSSDALLEISDELMRKMNEKSLLNTTSPPLKKNVPQYYLEKHIADFYQ
jgi:hypothetical protein